MSAQNGHAAGLAGAMVHAPHGPGLVKIAEPLDFTPDQQAMIRDTFANGASASEFAVLLEVARARRLNPLLRQIHFVKRWDSQKRRDVWSTQAAIDGLRAIAQRTGLYAGQDEPEFIEERGHIVACKARVYRRDWQRPAVGVAYWAEYVQTTRDGSPTRFWQQMPHVMIAKCAEALALRKAFPEDMSGLYVPEEMAQADNPAPAYIPDGRPALPAASDPSVLDRALSAVDGAHSVADLNSVASKAVRAHKSGAITDAQLDAIKVAVTARRAALAAPTSSPDVDPDGSDAREADAEAMATGGDS